LLQSPWKPFLTELDEALTEPLELHCIGGFALVHFYGLPRSTGDIDYYSAIPANIDLETAAGEGSKLHRKYHIWLHRVGVVNLPESYDKRLTDMAPGEFQHLKLLVPDAYDCILSKLERHATKDLDDAEYLFRSQNLDVITLQERYKSELRPNLVNQEHHDLTMKLWTEIFKGP
jgi:hypothetical protein